MIPEYQVEELYERCSELGFVIYDLRDKMQNILDFLTHSHITIGEMEKVEEIINE